jgi:uncharacterized membrane protein YhaH (DUF805 family)
MGVAVAMHVRRLEDIPETVHWCLLLIKFVSCNGRCRLCSADYLRSRVSVAG